MNLRQALSLTLRSVRRGRRTFLLSVFGITVGVASLAFFLALSAGVQGRVLSRVFPPGRLTVVAPTSSLATGGVLGALGELAGPPPLSEQTAAALRALPEVASVAPRLKIAFPVRGWGGERLIGRPVYLELVLDGIDPAAVAAQAAEFGPLPFADHGAEPERSKPCTGDPDCPAPTYCAWDINRCQLPVPVLVSPMLVELYNGSLARVHGLPRIGGFLLSQLRGFTFTAELGRSFVSRDHKEGTARQRRLMLVGVSDRAMPIGATVPLPYVQRWNQEYAGAAAAQRYSSLLVQVRPGRSVTAVAEAVRRMGLTIEDNGAEQVGLALTLLTAVFLLVSLAIVLVAAVNIAHTFFRSVSERRRELGVMRAVGARERDIEVLILLEAAAVGVCGGAAGLGVAYLCALGVDLASRRLLPDFPFKPASYFLFSPGLCAGALAFAVLACLLGAYLPARAAARLSPAEALSGPGR